MAAVEWENTQVLLLSCPVLSSVVSLVLSSVLSSVLCPLSSQPYSPGLLCPGHGRPPHGCHGVGDQAGTAPVLSCTVLSHVLSSALSFVLSYVLSSALYSVLSSVLSTQFPRCILPWTTAGPPTASSWPPWSRSGRPSRYCSGPVLSYPLSCPMSCFCLVPRLSSALSFILAPNGWGPTCPPSCPLSCQPYSPGVLCQG